MQLKSGCFCGSTSSTSSRIGPAKLRPILPARRSRSSNVSVSAFAAGPALVSQLATTFSFAVGAWWFSKEMMQLEQDRFDSSGQQPCPRCGGTGYEACMCTRWSDKDTGCSTCNRTGYMCCRSCGGGGTAVPIRVAIGKDGSQQQM